MAHFKVQLRHDGGFTVEADRVVVKDYGLEFLKLQPDDGETARVYETTCFVPLEQLFFVRREDAGGSETTKAKPGL